MSEWIFAPAVNYKKYCYRGRGLVRAKVGVLLGVTIGKHSVVGANSVITHDIPLYVMAVGAPAKVIKYRNVEKQKVRTGMKVKI